MKLTNWLGLLLLIFTLFAQVPILDSYIFFILEELPLNYRPPYLDHFEKPASAKNKNESLNTSSSAVPNTNPSNIDNVNGDDLKNSTSNSFAQTKAQEVINKRLLEQISGGQIPEENDRSQNSKNTRENNTVTNSGGGEQAHGKFQRCIAEGDLDFVSLELINYIKTLWRFLVIVSLCLDS